MFTLSLLLGVGLLIQPAIAQGNGDANGNSQAAGATHVLTPAERGDIYMARKMYRDAIETYMQAPVSAQMLNKIGIAYHQLADIDTAGKYYARAIKTDPQFSDAI